MRTWLLLLALCAIAHADEELAFRAFTVTFTDNNALIVRTVTLSRAYEFHLSGGYVVLPDGTRAALPPHANVSASANDRLIAHYGDHAAVDCLAEETYDDGDDRFFIEINCAVKLSVPNATFDATFEVLTAQQDVLEWNEHEDHLLLSRISDENIAILDFDADHAACVEQHRHEMQCGAQGGRSFRVRAETASANATLVNSLVLAVGIGAIISVAYVVYACYDAWRK